MPTHAKTPTETAAIMMHVIRAEDLNMHGSLYGGRMMSLLDTTAAIPAMRHGQRNCVTGHVSDIAFTAPARLGHIVIINARLTFAARSSMEVFVRAEREDHVTGDRKEICRAYFTFIAIDDDNAPASVPPLEPQTDDEKRMFEQAKARYEERKASRQTMLRQKS